MCLTISVVGDLNHDLSLAQETPLDLSIAPVMWLFTAAVPVCDYRSLVAPVASSSCLSMWGCDIQ